MFPYKQIVVGVLFASMFASAQVNVSLVNNEVSWVNMFNQGYSPFDKKGYYSKSVIEVNIPINLEGDYFIGFGNNSNSSKRVMKNVESQEELIYFISKSPNMNQYLVDWPNIVNEDNAFVFSFTGTNSPIERLPIYIWIDPGQNRMPGVYIDRVPLKLYSGSYTASAMPTEEASLVLTIKTIVTNAVQVSLGNDMFSSITAFKINYETLKKGETLSYKVYVKSLKNYELSIYSENESKLAHENKKIKTKVPYDLYIDDQLIQFDNQKSNMMVVKDSFEEVSEHQFKVILGESSHAFKGEYFDKLTVQAFSKD